MNDDSRQEVLGLIQEWETQQEVRLGVQQRAALVEHIYAFGLGITESAWRRTIMSRYVSTTNPLVRYPGVSDVAQMVRRSPRAGRCRGSPAPRRLRWRPRP